MTWDESFDPTKGVPGVGSFAVRFKPGTETRILGPHVAATGVTSAGRVQNQRRNTLVLTPSRLSNPDRTTLLDNAVFSGIMERFQMAKRGQPWGITGTGILAWLGSTDGPGVGPYGGYEYSPDNIHGNYPGSFADYLLTLLVGLTYVSTNGISFDATAPSISTAAMDVPISAADTLRTRINKLTSSRGLEYTCRPDGVCIWQVQDDPGEYAFTLNPTVIIGEGIKAGREAGLVAYEGDVIPSFDYSTEASQYFLSNSDGTIHLSGGIGGRMGNDFGGVDEAVMSKFYGASDELAGTIGPPSTSGTGVGPVLTRELVRTDDVAISLNAACLRSDVKPGDWIWAVNQRCDLINLANAVAHGGQDLHPVTLRITRMTSPITDAMGKYILTNHTGYGGAYDRVIDVSDLVVPDTGDTKVMASTGAPRTLRRAVFGSQFRPSWEQIK